MSSASVRISSARLCQCVRIIDLIGRHRILPPSSCSSALTRLRVGRFDKRHDITNFPQAIDHASGHRGRHAQRLMDADEIVMGCEQCDGPSVIFKPLAKRIRQSRESSRVHPDVQVCRSANDVLMCFGSGLPSIGVLTAPVHSAGL